MTTRIGEILPGKKLDPWCEGMEDYLPDGADVVITNESQYSYAVESLDSWHNGLKDTWYVHKDNIRLKGLPLKGPK